MNRRSYVTVLLAVCCIGAVGISSTTLNSSLSQNPDDVVELDYSKLPIGEDEGKSLKGALQNDEGEPGTGGSGEKSDAESSNPQSSDSSQSSSSSAQSSQSDSESSGSDGSTGASNSDGPGQNAGGTLSLLDRLLQLLKQLLPFLLLLVALALAYRYRRELLALLAVLFDRVSGSTEDRRSSAFDWPSERPSTEVHQAWLSMVDRIDIDRPWTRTPDECADAARGANLDPTAVEMLTAVFEEVRYGGKPVTDERRRRAREGLDRLDGISARGDGGNRANDGERRRDDVARRDGGGPS